MADDGKAKIERLSTGVPALDGILGGGVPTRSLNIIAGGPGTGKSVLALQMLFHQARLGQRNVYFTSLAEPAVKFLRYMQQFEFFDASLVDKTVFLFDLAESALSGGLEAATQTLQQRLKDEGPAIIAIDSFKALRSRLRDQSAADPILYDLVVKLAVSGVTTFLVGEYDAHDVTHLPEFFAADGIISLSANTEGLRAARQLEVLKLRGSSFAAGRHFFEITSAGITVYPRVSVPAEQEIAPETAPRLSLGVPSVDEMMGGGAPYRSATVIEGGTGTGKTTLALGFLVEGARRGESGVMFTMDETREQLIQTGVDRGWEIRTLIEQGLLEIVYKSPLELVADALFLEAKERIARMGARRVVVDSLTSLNLSIASHGRAHELVYALGKSFRALGVTAVMTSETPQLVGTAELTAGGLSAFADNIIVLRYVEIESRLVNAIAVLKVRGSQHEHVLRRLRITADSVEVLAPFEQYRGVLTGVPTPEAVRPTARRGRTRKPQT